MLPLRTFAGGGGVFGSSPRARAIRHPLRGVMGCSFLRL
jgi:hypothetical protein